MSTTNAVPVDPSNTEQLRAWDGDAGAYWATHAEHFDRALAGYHDAFLAAAAIDTADRVVDIGCGAGRTTIDAAIAARSGSALGVDLSSVMIECARRRAAAERVANAAFEQADAQIHPFPTAAFDVAVSRTGAMFFGDSVAAFSNIAGALRRGGRLVLLAWQSATRNEWFRDFTGALAAGRDLPLPSPDAPGPFSLSDSDRVRATLAAAGFTGIEIDGTSTGMWFGTDTDDACRFVLGQLGWMLDGLDEVMRRRAVEALRSAVAAHETDEGVVYASAAWTIRARRAPSP